MIRKTNDIPTAISAAQRKRNQGALRLLRQWMADETGYDERSWPIARKVIEANRLSRRKPFHA